MRIMSGVIMNSQDEYFQNTKNTTVTETLYTIPLRKNYYFKREYNNEV